MPIIEKLDALARTRTDDDSTAIIDGYNLVHMANMDIHFTHSTNGVAALHTQILKESELANFYRLYPEKFNNKTNGITFRRWLLECNPALTGEVEALIGSGFKQNADELEKLLAFTEDKAVLQRLADIKAENKQALSDWLYHKQGLKSIQKLCLLSSPNVCMNTNASSSICCFNPPVSGNQSRS